MERERKRAHPTSWQGGFSFDPRIRLGAETGDYIECALYPYPRQACSTKMYAQPLPMWRNYCVASRFLLHLHHNCLHAVLWPLSRCLPAAQKRRQTSLPIPPHIRVQTFPHLPCRRHPSPSQTGKSCRSGGNLPRPQQHLPPLCHQQLQHLLALTHHRAQLLPNAVKWLLAAAWML